MIDYLIFKMSIRTKNVLYKNVTVHESKDNSLNYQI